MKKQVIAFIIALFSIPGYSQINAENRNYINSLGVSPLRRDGIEKSAAIGSPYINKTFLPAKVQNGANGASMRYDAYHDQFEFINTTNDTLILNKDSAYGKITFSVGSKSTFQLVDYTIKDGQLTKGYLILLYEKKEYALFKKQSINFEKEKIAKSGYEADSPARFTRAEDSFYLKNGDKGIFLFPPNKKGLLKLFPEQNADMELFIKQYNIDFDKEQDLIKIIDFLST